MRIPPHIIDEVRVKSDIVDVIGEYVKLRHTSRNYLGLCPFHKEKTPSFNVNPERGIFKCFGCGKAGNVITFVEEHLNLGFVDAIKFLANRAGIEIPEERREDPNGEYARRDNALRALREAADFYQEHLATSDGAPARTFFSKRGFNPQTQQDFKLGAAPAAWDTTMNHLLARGFQIEHLVDAGIVITREDGKTYDRFRGRAMFTICDDAGRVVGFSARTLTDEAGQPKYVNSPQSIVFEKSRLLYGLDRAKRSISQQRTAILVEGQADVITLHQAGITNTVASSGTALTPEQLRILKRHADVIILVFDSDEAGQKAITRGIELGLASGYDVKCVALPQGQDPDSLVRELGAESLLQSIRNAPSWLQFQTERFRNQGLLDDAAQQARAVRIMLEWISQVPDTLRHPFLIRELSESFRLNEQFLSAELQRLRSTAQSARTSADSQRIEPTVPGTPKPPQEVLQPRTTAVMLPSERELIRIALGTDHGLALLLHDAHVTEQTFWSQSGQKIFRSILIADAEHSNPAEHVIHDPTLTSDERRELADAVFTHASPSSAWRAFDVELPDVDLLRIIRDALIKIGIHRTHQDIDTLTQLIESTADLDERKRHVFAITQKIQRREELRKLLESDTRDFTWLLHEQP